LENVYFKIRRFESTGTSKVTPRSQCENGSLAPA
jgi:hypothetical protein